MTISALAAVTMARRNTSRERAQLSPGELRQLESVKEAALGRAVTDTPALEREAMRRAISHLFERRSVVSEHEILAEALNQQLGGVRLDRLKTAMETAIPFWRSRRLRRQPMCCGRRVFVTRTP